MPQQSSKTLRFLAALSAFWAIWFIPWVFLLKFGLIGYSAYEADGIRQYTRVTGPLQQFLPLGVTWVGDGDIRSSCRAALVAAEDVRFYSHRGIDPKLIIAALQRNWWHKKIVWGGSTITQQLVKNTFLSREKTAFRKLREMLGAMVLDRIMDKSEQLDWYLNVAEFGPRVYGIQDAAQLYFQRDANELTLSQCISLFSILPDPVRYSQSLIDHTPTRRQRRTYRAILCMLERSEAAQPGEIAQAKVELL